MGKYVRTLPLDILYGCIKNIFDEPIYSLHSWKSEKQKLKFHEEENPIKAAIILN